MKGLSLLTGLIKKVTDTGLVKPLPLTGLGKEIAKVRDAKNKLKAVLRVAGYILTGITIYGVIFKGLAPETAQMIFESIAKMF